MNRIMILRIICEKRSIIVKVLKIMAWYVSLTLRWNEQTDSNSDKELNGFLDYCSMNTARDDDDGILILFCLPRKWNSL
jgi:hypothetical protein